MAGTPHDRQLAIDYIRANPSANNVEVARELSISKRTVAYARAQLRASGELPAGRRTAPNAPDEMLASLAPVIAQVTPAAEALDGPPTPGVPPSIELPPPIPPSALPTLPDDGEVDADEDENSIRRRIIAVARGFALNPELHPDTRLSASQVYMKLKDALKAKELGPGKPLTKEQAISRLSSLLRATGPDLALEALTRAFNLERPTNAQGSPGTVHSPDAPPPPPETP